MPAVHVITRVVSFGGSSVRIDCRGDKAVELVDFLYGDLPPYEAPAPHIVFTMRAEPELQKLIVRVGKAVYYRGSSLGGLAAALMAQTQFHLADKSAGGLLLHSAAVTCGGRCVLFPARTGAGKSTLMAWLITKGLGYLTDELIYIPLGSQDVQAFVRPLSIKASGRSVLEQQIPDFETRAPQFLASPEVTLIPSRALGQREAVATARVDMIVFPNFRADAPFSYEPTSPAQTGMELMGCLINARNLPEHGFPEVTRLARDVPGYHLTYGDVSQLEGWVQDMKASTFGKA